MAPPIVHDAIRYWEPRRLWYNLALTGLGAAWVFLTWPHFQPALSLQPVLQLLVFAALANLCYSAAYLVDIPLLQSPFAGRWRQWRWALWLIGTLLALVLAQYWIGDEISPFVDAA